MEDQDGRWPDWMGRQLAARYLGISTRKLIDLTRENRIQSVLRDNHRVYHRRWLDSYQLGERPPPMKPEDMPRPRWTRKGRQDI